MPYNNRQFAKKRLDKYFKSPYVKKFNPIVKGGTIGSSLNTGINQNMLMMGRAAQSLQSLGFSPIIDRMSRYSEYAVMEYNAELQAGLDIFADDSTTKFLDGDVLHINTEHNEVQKELSELYFDTLNLNFNLWGWVRDTLKFGDNFILLDLAIGHGVVGALPLSVYEVERVEDIMDAENPVKFILNNNVDKEFSIWEMAHFKMHGNKEFYPYGVSILESCRRYFRQLCLAGDTDIWTESGYKKIKDVNNGDIIYSFDYNSNKIIKTVVKNMSYMGKQKLYEVVTNHRKIYATDKHGFLVETSAGDRIYKPVNEIITTAHNGHKQDKLVLPVIKDGMNEHVVVIPNENYRVKLKNKLSYDKTGIMDKLRNLGKFTKTSAKNLHTFLQGNGRYIHYSDFLLIKDEFEISYDDIIIKYKMSNKESILNKKLEFNVNKEFVRFFGFMLGDGWAKDNKVGFALSIYEDINNRYIDYIKNLGISYYKTDRKIELEDREWNSSQINASNTEFMKIMHHLGFISGFDKKRIPSWVFKLNAELRMEFLKGIMDSDGCWSNKILSFANKELIYDVKNLAMQTGVTVGNVSDNKIRSGINPLTNNPIIRKKSYSLYLNFDIINNDYITENVTKINEFVEDDTYDIEVDHDLHNFIANGVVSHNTMLEDSMLIYRIVRSPERRVVYIDVGGLDSKDVEPYVNEVAATLKNIPIDADNTGNFDYRLNPMSMLDDYVIPVRGKDTATKIDTLKGTTHLTDMQDIKYIQRKLVTSLKIPLRYLGLDDESKSDLKNAAAQEDIRFSRTIERIQSAIISELKKIGIIHLILKGYADDVVESFDIEMKNPSSASEIEKLEVIKQKFGIAADILEGKLASRDWVYENILTFTKDEVDIINKDLSKDFEFMSKLTGYSHVWKQKYMQDAEKEYNIEKPQDALGGAMGGGEQEDPEQTDVAGEFRGKGIGGDNSVGNRLLTKSPSSTILRPYENAQSIIDSNKRLLKETNKDNKNIGDILKEYMYKNISIYNESNAIKEDLGIDN